MKWQKIEIIESTRTKTGVIKLSTPTGQAKYTAIRAGLDPESQYYLICGLEWFDDGIYALEPTHRAIDVLLEYRHEGLVLDDLFHKMVSDARLFFSDFWMDRDENHNEDFCKAYYHFQSKHTSPYGALLPAPWTENFKLGLGKIKSLVKENRLDVNKNTLIFDQLTKITQADLENAAVKSTFFCVEALRHVINSFDFSKPIQPQAKPYRAPSYRDPRLGWMA